MQICASLARYQDSCRDKWHLESESHFKNIPDLQWNGPRYADVNTNGISCSARMHRNVVAWILKLSLSITLSTFAFEILQFFIFIRWLNYQIVIMWAPTRRLLHKIQIQFTTREIPKMYAVHFRFFLSSVKYWGDVLSTTEEIKLSNSAGI